MNEIIVPEKLKPIIEAFFADSPRTAKSLIIQAAKAIYGSEEETGLFDFDLRKKHNITPDELENICTLMQGIKPKDTLEALFAAQIVVSHLLGFRKLARGHIDDQRIGLKMLKFSSESMALLHRKRNGGMQNIIANYNNSGPALMQIAETRNVHAD